MGKKQKSPSQENHWIEQIDLFRNKLKLMKYNKIKTWKRGNPGFMKNGNIFVEPEGHQDTRDRHCVHKQDSENWFSFL